MTEENNSQVVELQAEQLELVVSEKTIGSLTTNAKQIRDLVQSALPKYDISNYSTDDVAKAKEDKMAAPVSKAVSQIAEREELESGNETDDAELVAVITAAVAAFAGASGGTSGDGFVVRSIRRRY